MISGTKGITRPSDNLGTAFPFLLPSFGSARVAQRLREPQISIRAAN